MKNKREKRADNKPILILADPKGKTWGFAQKIYEKLSSPKTEQSILHKVYRLIANKQEEEYELEEVEISKFNDGEIFTKIKESVRQKSCYFIHDSSMYPQDWLISLAFIEDALIRSDAKEINFILPYMKYSRQDRMTDPRTPISTRVVAKNIQGRENLKIRVITTDLHNPASVNAYDIPLENLRAYPAIIDYIKENHSNMLENALLLAPDPGAMQIANSYAKRMNFGIVSAYKKREKAGIVGEIEIMGDVKGKNTIITDDMIDTGETLCKASELLERRGARRIYACATHGIFSGKAKEKLNNSCLEKIIVTDSIPQENDGKIEVVSLTDLFTEAIYRISHGISISELYE